MAASVGSRVYPFGNGLRVYYRVEPGANATASASDRHCVQRALGANGNVYLDNLASLESGNYVPEVQAMIDIGDALLDFAAGS